MYMIVIILVLFATLSNIVWPMIVQKSQFEAKVMNYILSNNITSPYCYTKYMAKVSRSILDINIEIGTDLNGYFTDCNIIPENYYKCRYIDYSNTLHPCSFVRSFFRIFAL